MNILRAQQEIRNLKEARYAILVKIYSTLKQGDVIEYYPRRHWKESELSFGMIFTLSKDKGSFLVTNKKSIKTGKETKGGLKYFSILEVLGILKINNVPVEHIEIGEI